MPNNKKRIIELEVQTVHEDVTDQEIKEGIQQVLEDHNQTIKTLGIDVKEVI